jgi:beta-lactamase class A
LVCTAALVTALVDGCGPSATPAANAGDVGVRINTNTPPGVRARQVMDMLNSDWPIGPIGIKTLATPDMVDPIGTEMDGMWYDRPYTVAGVDIGAGAATLHVVTSYGARQDIELHTNDTSLLVDRFKVSTQTPEIKSWADVDAVLSKTGARYSYRVSRVNDGQCEQFAGSNTAESLPLASIFKTYVLYAVAEEITAGRLSWDDQLTITAEGKAVGSSGFDKLPPGSLISVRTAAQKMISNSDNMATDLLISRVGTHAVERALVEAGHHDPASMTPFPTMHELFAIGWGEPDLREQWKQAVANHSPEARAQLLAQTDSVPYQPDPERTRIPASAFGVEWYGSAEDICKIHAALQADANGAAAPVRDIMSAIPGIDLDRSQWPYIGAKAGNLPGDLTFSWYTVDRTGQPWVTSFQLNWPRHYGPSAGGWMMSIVTQVFGMMARQP